MMKRLCKAMAAALTVAVFLTGFAFIQPVSAETVPDLEKANVKWDLQNGQTVKYKQVWYSLGAKKHSAKITNFQITDADTPGYKQCTFKLTLNVKIKPNKKQVLKMANRYERTGAFTKYGYCVTDYSTGYELGAENDKDVTVTSTWKHSKFKKFKGLRGSWIKQAMKSVATVTVIYPETYTDLAIGVVGGSNNNYANANAFWDGDIPFSKATSLYSKKDKSFAHFMRVQ